MPDLTLLPRAEEDTKEEPPKKWFNWYRARIRHRSVRGWRDAGDVYPSEWAWPSRDAAETCRFHALASGVAPSGAPYTEARGETNWLGAFPEGERPDV